ncbi:MAG: hypothetical protein WCV56_01225 [Candidatus Omnitrophota bacterium]
MEDTNWRSYRSGHLCLVKYDRVVIFNNDQAHNNQTSKRHIPPAERTEAAVGFEVEGWEKEEVRFRCG